MIRALRADPVADFALVPVAVYWGARPTSEASWLRLLLVEDWVLTSRLRNSFRCSFNGRDTLVEIDEPLSLRALLGTDLQYPAARPARDAHAAGTVRAPARRTHRS